MIISKISIPKTLPLSVENSTKHDDIFKDDFCIDDDNEILNSEISQEEIFQCIRSLKNGKAAGDDRIVNEYTVYKSYCTYIYANILKVIQSYS